MALPNITTANFNAASSNLDLLPHNIEAPIKKLDADNYMAEDIDGVTESLFGSGNMNFLSLQSGQTDAAIDNAAIGSDSNALNGLEFNTNSSAFSNQTNTPDNFSSLNAGGSSNPNDILSSIGDRFADNTTQIDIGNEQDLNNAVKSAKDSFEAEGQIPPEGAPRDQYLGAHIEVDAYAHEFAEELLEKLGKRAALDITRGKYSLRPLLDWTTKDIYYYMQKNNLPQHPFLNLILPLDTSILCSSPIHNELSDKNK
mgnify:CR=1 FL=1